MMLASTKLQTNNHTQGNVKSQNGISFAGMVRGELMKLMWSRSTWIMLAVLIGGMATLSLFNLASQNVHDLLLHNPVQYAYDYELSQNLLVFRVLSGFFALLVTAISIGLEYQQGTIRVLLGRGVGRVHLLLSKLIALFLLAVFVQLGGLLLNGVLLTTVTSVITGSFSAVGVILAHCTGIFLQFFLYLIGNMWVCILLASAVTVLGRSLPFGLSVALMWFPVDNFSNRIVPALLGYILPEDLAMKMSNALLGPVLNVLPIVAISPRIINESVIPAVTIGEGQTIAVVLVYALVFLAIAMLLIRFRDVR